MGEREREVRPGKLLVSRKSFLGRKSGGEVHRDWLHSLAWGRELGMEKKKEREKKKVKKKKIKKNRKGACSGREAKTDYGEIPAWRRNKLSFTLLLFSVIYSSYSSLFWLKAKKTWMEMITVESWWWPWRSSSPHHDGETQGRVSLHEWIFQYSIIHEPSWWWWWWWWCWLILIHIKYCKGKDRISNHFDLPLGYPWIFRYESHTASSSSKPWAIDLRIDNNNKKNQVVVLTRWSNNILTYHLSPSCWRWSSNDGLMHKYKWLG